MEILPSTAQPQRLLCGVARRFLAAYIVAVVSIFKINKHMPSSQILYS